MLGCGAPSDRCATGWARPSSDVDLVTHGDIDEALTATEFAVQGNARIRQDTPLEPPHLHQHRLPPPEPVQPVPLPPPRCRHLVVATRLQCPVDRRLVGLDGQAAFHEAAHVRVGRRREAADLHREVGEPAEQHLVVPGAGRRTPDEIERAEDGREEGEDLGRAEEIRRGARARHQNEEHHGAVAPVEVPAPALVIAQRLFDREVQGVEARRRAHDFGGGGGRRSGTLRVVGTGEGRGAGRGCGGACGFGPVAVHNPKIVLRRRTHNRPNGMVYASGLCVNGVRRGGGIPAFAGMTERGRG
jgi:hypothetical protein